MCVWMRIGRVFGVFFACGLVAGCTATRIEGGASEVDLSAVLFGSISGGYKDELAADRRRRAERLQIAEKLEVRLEGWLAALDRWGGNDVVSLEIDRFRLPAVARGLTAGFKGNDYLGVEVTVMRDAVAVVAFHAEHQLGAGDRSVTANYSANAALTQLVDSVAWAVLLELTPPKMRKPVFEIGKAAEVPKAIQLLEECGELSYAESLGFVAKGLIPASIAAGAETRRLKRALGGDLPKCY